MKHLQHSVPFLSRDKRKQVKEYAGTPGIHAPTGWTPSKMQHVGTFEMQ